MAKAKDYTIRADSWLGDTTFEIKWSELSDEVRSWLLDGGLRIRMRGVVSSIKKGDDGSPEREDAITQSVARENALFAAIKSGSVPTAGAAGGGPRISERTKLAREQMVIRARKQAAAGGERAQAWVDTYDAHRESDKAARAHNRENKGSDGYVARPQFAAVAFVDEKLRTASDGFWKDIDAALAPLASDDGDGEDF